ncbi:hypothetical protein [Kitasatospora sp. NPDC089509]|uniref:hypothetical protein n=1 Tax=Kitasatospora sp. NPDC089509 TaxID=3364079 RepID=UPI0037FB4E63
MTTSQGDARGHVLLLATASKQRHHEFDTELGVAAMAAITPQMMLRGWNGPVDIAQVVNPGEPQSVLARIHAAAIAAGPLVIYLCGQVTRDRRQKQLHIILAKTTESTKRYTSLPWGWIDLELSRRPPNTTHLIVDLQADQSCVPMGPIDLQLPPHVARWGVVTMPKGRFAGGTTPAYSKALARLLAAPGAGHLSQVHAMAVEAAGLAPSTVVLGEPAAAPAPAAPREADRPAQPSALSAWPNPQPPGPLPATTARPVGKDLRSAITHAMNSGDFGTAARMATQWEHQVTRDQGHEGTAMGDVLETQAVIAARGGDATRATQLWIKTAQHRTAWSPPGSEAVRTALQNAQASWFQLDTSWPQSRPLGSELATVLREARQTEAAAAVEQRLAVL